MVIDICPYNANPAWCPSQESAPKNSVGMEYHFDVSFFEMSKKIITKI